jgi:2,3-bisphosphoglycerate-independent phosphoglycerate mutase
MSQILCIFDGFGLAKKTPNNAIYLSKMPNFRSLLSNSFWTTLDADGENVGQEAGLVGNSEVGHMNLGGLRLVAQLSYQITEIAKQNFKLNSDISPDQKIDPNVFFENYKSKNPQVNLHLIGLFSSGKVHSDTRHFIGAIKSGLNAGFEKIILHLFTDGRDSDRQSFLETYKKFETDLVENGVDLQKIVIGSIGGRFYAMDRDKNWDRIMKGLVITLNPELIGQIQELNYQDHLHLNKDLLSFLKDKFEIDYHKIFENLEFYRNNDLEISLNLGEKNIQDNWFLNGYEHEQNETLEKYILENYKKEIYDEHIVPVSFEQGIQANDIVWVQNFRADRVRQLIQILVQLNKQFGWNLQILTNNEYAVPEIQTSDYIQVFQNQPVARPLAEVISKENQTQLHIAETEKYNHVTYFLNGGQNKQFEGETWQIIPSNKVESHAQKPEMKAKEITDFIIENISKYDKVIVNYANPDMVGHTGDLKATIESLEFLDKELGRLMEICKTQNHSLILTADHGNAEIVGFIETENRTDTEHNLNPVPLIIYNSDLQKLQNNLTILADKYHLQELDKALTVLAETNQIDLTNSETWLETIPKSILGLHWAGIFFLGL